jgi:hypothetical protein
MRNIGITLKSCVEYKVALSINAAAIFELLGHEPGRSIQWDKIKIENPLP